METGRRRAPIARHRNPNERNLTGARNDYGKSTRINSMSFSLAHLTKTKTKSEIPTWGKLKIASDGVNLDDADDDAIMISKIRFYFISSSSPSPSP